MKQQLLNKIFIGLLFILVLILLPNFKVSAKMLMEMNGGGSGGGTYTPPASNPTAPAPVLGAINLVVGLDKKANSPYNIGETIKMSATASVNACSNTSFNLRVTGTIMDATGTKIIKPAVTIMDQFTKGGTVIAADNTDFVAPSPAGTYKMYFEAIRYDRAGYVLNNAYKGVESYLVDYPITFGSSNFLITTNYRGVIIKIRPEGDEVNLMDMIPHMMSAKIYSTDTHSELTITESSEEIIKKYSATQDFIVAGITPVIVPIAPKVTVLINGLENPGPVTKGTEVRVSWVGEGDNVDKCYEVYPSGHSKDGQKTNRGGVSKVDPGFLTTIGEQTTFKVECTDKGGEIITPEEPDPEPLPNSCKTYYPTCFIADTIVILSDGSTKNIQDVKVGDILKGETTNNTVLGLHRPELNGKLYSFNGGRYFVTEEHPFKTTDGWKSINPEKTRLENIGIEVTSLYVGDTLVTEDGLIKINTIDNKKSGSGTDLFNFILDGDHTYYADGYLVHNKLAAKSCEGGNSYCGDSGFCVNPVTGQEETSGLCSAPCGDIGVNCKAGYTKTCEGSAIKCVSSSCSIESLNGTCNSNFTNNTVCKNIKDRNICLKNSTCYWLTNAQ